jgi:hypothetical protein
MTLRSPASAILWELWRVTRAEIAWKLVLPTGAGLTALGLAAAFGPSDNPARYRNINDLAAAVALVLIVIPSLPGWISMARLTGGQPGFPLYLGYTRPVRTAWLVGLPMAYLTAMSGAIYLASALVLRVASGHAFPLLPVAAWMAALTVVWLAAAWSTRTLAIQVVVGMVATVKALGWAIDRLTAVEIPDGYDWPPRLWPALFDWPRTDYAWIALIGLASFGVTIAMVTRQRRGDQLVAITRTPGGLRRAESKGRLWDRLVSTFRVPCPTASATRAQVWLDLRSNGLPVLTIGVTLAMVILLVSAVSGPIDAAINADPDVSCPIAECFYVRAAPPLMLTPFSLLTVLFLGRNAFGIRRKQGRTYVSAFEAAQAYGTARLAVVKLLVQSVCVLAALIAIVASFWVSVPLLGDAVFIQIWGLPLSSRRSVITEAFAALTAYEQLALAIVAGVGVVIGVAAFAVFGALRIRYSRRATIASVLLLLYGVAFVWLAVGVRVDPKTASQFHLDVVYGGMCWIAAAAIVSTTIYAFQSGFAEHVLTIRYASGAVAVSAAFGAAWLTALHTAGVQLAGMSAINVISVVSPALLPLMASGLAPWSYSRIRHT